jgi:protease I
MATLLMPLPDSDFDPTESGVPRRTMHDHGHRVVFATPSGRTARADPKMVTGEGLGILSPLLKADANGRSAYLEMEQSDAGFRRPISYGEIRAADFDGLILTGGHAPGMRVYLGSGVLQSAVADFFAQKKPVGAICHGVLLAARSSFHPGKSVLYGKKTTALTKQMELIAWRLTVSISAIIIGLIRPPSRTRFGRHWRDPKTSSQGRFRCAAIRRRGLA